MADYTYYTRLEPRPRANDFSASLAAEIRDPLWFLTRQWQVGEFAAVDAGSVAFVEQAGSSSRLARWIRQGSEVTIDPNAPLERQVLREPFEPDLSMQAELGQEFVDLLAERLGDVARARAIGEAFRQLDGFELEDPEDQPLVPVDPATTRFMLVCGDRMPNGLALLELATSGGAIPDSVSTSSAEIAEIQAALQDLVAHVEQVFGEVRRADPVTWQPDRLEYRLKVVAPSPSTTVAGNATLSAIPDGDGEFDWFSFEVDSKNTSAVEPAPEAVSDAILPARIEFDGMPSPRFWKFEENNLALPDVSVFSDDLLKNLITNFMLFYSTDWYVFPFQQEPGTLMKTNHLLVHDVFDTLTIVERADKDVVSAGTDRFSMFSITDGSGGLDRVADYFLVPPSPGPALQLGSVLEDVRFGRDEMANMAFGIERVTTSPIGEQRSGNERDAEIDARRPAPPAAAEPSTFPLTYRIQSEIPANWVPLLPHQPSSGNPSIVLQKAAALKDVGSGPLPVPALGAILNPPLGAGAVYRIQEEEIPRSGLRVERVVCRTRWLDGSTHLWVQRRRSVGAGESQSGLKFDQALPNSPREVP